MNPENGAAQVAAAQVGPLPDGSSPVEHVFGNPVVKTSFVFFEILLTFECLIKISLIIDLEDNWELPECG